MYIYVNFKVVFKQFNCTPFGNTHFGITYTVYIYYFLLDFLHARTAFPNKIFYVFLEFFPDDGPENPKLIRGNNNNNNNNKG